MSADYKERERRVGAPDGSGTQLPSTQAREGLISGRVLTVLIASVVGLALIYAIIWFAGAH
ncbi:MAG TPA: hypothetical protein VHW02_14240 [Rhizomicrobium sp.]|jgi:hypothetical protein|nr:hypothetical protein [Rhizomicrobium sp.]